MHTVTSSDWIPGCAGSIVQAEEDASATDQQLCPSFSGTKLGYDLRGHAWEITQYAGGIHPDETTLTLRVPPGSR